MQSIHYDDPPYEERIIFDLDEIGRQGVRKMLVQALEAEVEAYLLCGGGQRGV